MDEDDNGKFRLERVDLNQPILQAFIWFESCQKRIIYGSNTTVQNQKEVSAHLESKSFGSARLYSGIQINRQRMMFADFTGNSQLSLMQFCNHYFLFHHYKILYEISSTSCETITAFRL